MPDTNRHYNTNHQLLCNDCGKPYDTRQSCLANERFPRWGDEFEAEEIDRNEPSHGHGFCDDCQTPIGGYHHQQCNNKVCIPHGASAYDTLMGATWATTGMLVCDCIAGPTPVGFN